MVALDRALVNVCSLVAIPLIQFGRNALCKFWEYGTLFGENRSGMLPLDRALVQ